MLPYRLMIVARLCIGLAAMVAAEKAQRVPGDGLNRGKITYALSQMVVRAKRDAEELMQDNSALQITQI
jgi:hypothetical protein